MLDKLKDKTCYFIAEIGGNFTTYEEAVKLIDGAHYAGVDAVKIQTFKAETICSKDAYFDMEYTGKISQFEYFKKYEIDKELHSRIFNYAQNKGLDWFSTPSHQDDVDMLSSLGVKCYKVGADDATNVPFLKYMAKTNLPIILSTGMCTINEVDEAVSAIEEEGNNKIIILHTVSGYPTHPENINLNVLITLKQKYPHYCIGFSDHSLNTLAALAAATMGANVIERHFTLDKNGDGPDHKLSSTPDEMKELIDNVRLIETMKGSFIKMPFGPEILNRVNNRKSIVAIKNIKKGELLSPENISVKRPGIGIQPKDIQQILGKSAKINIDEDILISWKDVE